MSSNRREIVSLERSLLFTCRSHSAHANRGSSRTLPARPPAAASTSGRPAAHSMVRRHKLVRRPADEMLLSLWTCLFPMHGRAQEKAAGCNKLATPASRRKVALAGPGPNCRFHSSRLVVAVSSAPPAMLVPRRAVPCRPEQALRPAKAQTLLLIKVPPDLSALSRARHVSLARYGHI